MHAMPSKGLVNRPHRAILREADKTPVAGVTKKLEVSTHAISTWRRRFGVPEPADGKRLRQLESEPGRDEAPGGAVSALRLPRDPGVPAARRPRHEPASGAPPASALTKARGGGRLEEKLKFYVTPRLRIVDEIGYLPVDRLGAHSSSS